MKEIEEVMWEMSSEHLVEGPGSQPWKEIEDLNTLDVGLVLVLMVVQLEEHMYLQKAVPEST
jgi:hypothetical protein